MQLSIRFENPNPDTIWNRLAARLGRVPTGAEAAAEVKRILREAQGETDNAMKDRPMGNRAIITLEDAKAKQHPVALYVHWNGGIESVLAMIEYTWETFERGRDDLFTFHARLCQVIGNFFPDGLSLYGLPRGEVRRWEDGLDNGVHHFRIAPEGFSYLTAPDRVADARNHEYWHRPQPIKATIHSAMPRKDDKYNHVGGVIVDNESIPDALQVVGSKVLTAAPGAVQ